MNIIYIQLFNVMQPKDRKSISKHSMIMSILTILTQPLKYTSYITIWLLQSLLPSLRLAHLATDGQHSITG